MINLEQATLTGLYNGIVVDNEDPNSQGRVLVRLAWADETEKVEAWARVARLAATSRSATTTARGFRPRPATRCSLCSWMAIRRSPA